MSSQLPEDKEKVSMPSLWRAKLLMAQKDRVAEGLQVGSPVLVLLFSAWQFPSTKVERAQKTLLVSHVFRRRSTMAWLRPLRSCGPSGSR